MYLYEKGWPHKAVDLFQIDLNLPGSVKTSLTLISTQPFLFRCLCSTFCAHPSQRWPSRMCVWIIQGVLPLLFAQCDLTYSSNKHILVSPTVPTGPERAQSFDWGIFTAFIDFYCVKRI